jgi:hypothetical protein
MTLLQACSKFKVRHSIVQKRAPYHLQDALGYQIENWSVNVNIIPVEHAGSNSEAPGHSTEWEVEDLRFRLLLSKLLLHMPPQATRHVGTNLKEHGQAGRIDCLQYCRVLSEGNDSSKALLQGSTKPIPLRLSGIARSPASMGLFAGKTSSSLEACQCA